MRISKSSREHIAHSMFGRSVKNYHQKKQIFNEKLQMVWLHPYVL